MKDMLEDPGRSLRGVLGEEDGESGMDGAGAGGRCWGGGKGRPREAGRGGGCCGGTPCGTRHVWRGASCGSVGSEGADGLNRIVATALSSSRSKTPSGLSSGWAKRTVSPTRPWVADRSGAPTSQEPRGGLRHPSPICVRWWRTPGCSGRHIRLYLHRHPSPDPGGDGTVRRDAHLADLELAPAQLLGPDTNSRLEREYLQSYLTIFLFYVSYRFS